MSQEQALQAAQEAAQQLLDQDAKADRKNGRQRDAAKSNGPVGTTGATAMQAMAKGY
jgi:hypothetical protein